MDISCDHPVFVIGEIQDVKTLPPVLVTDWGGSSLFSRVVSLDVPNQCVHSAASIFLNQLTNDRVQRKELVRGILSDQGEALDNVTEEASLVMVRSYLRIPLN